MLQETDQLSGSMKEERTMGMGIKDVFAAYVLETYGWF